MTAQQTDRLLDTAAAESLQQHTQGMDYHQAQAFELAFRLGYVEGKMDSSRAIISKLQDALGVKP